MKIHYSHIPTTTTTTTAFLVREERKKKWEVIPAMHKRNKFVNFHEDHKSPWFHRSLWLSAATTKGNNYDRTDTNPSDNKKSNHGNNQQKQKNLKWPTEQRKQKFSIVSSSSSPCGFPRILLKRNRQSKMFRNGNQLIFSGAIDTIVQSSKEQQRPEDGIHLGRLVRVEVVNNGPNNNYSEEQKRKKKKKNMEEDDSKKKTQPSTASLLKEKKTTTTQMIGWGVWNPLSMYRVRILCHALLQQDLYQQLEQNQQRSVQHQDVTKNEEEMMYAIIQYQIQMSLQKRKSIGLPNDQTNTYRLVNGEGDYLSGLAIDIIGHHDNSEDDVVDDEISSSSLSSISSGSLPPPLAVIMSSAGWCEIHKQTILRAVQDVLPSHYEIVWKVTPTRLQQDGYTSSTTMTTTTTATTTKTVTETTTATTTAIITTNDNKNCNNKNDNNPSMVVKENGIYYDVQPYQDGQKTGFYCDQRENKYRLAQMIADAIDNNRKHPNGYRFRMLDLCCYHGGFALNAIIHGFRKLQQQQQQPFSDASTTPTTIIVTGVDSSLEAIETCRKNIQLNHDTIANNNAIQMEINFIQSDVTQFLLEQQQQQQHQQQQQQQQKLDNSSPSKNKDDKNTNHHHDYYYDVIVLDPPKLAPSLSGLEKARRKYHSLNRNAIQRICPKNGGLLLTCTCSAAMTQKDGGQYFLSTIHQAAMSSGRTITLLQVNGAASCHVQAPASYPSNQYLTAALFYVHPAPSS